MSLKKKWEKSYDNKENYLFYPNEEVVRFMSKNIRRRVGVKEFEDLHNFGHKPRLLALGCGVGRHIIFAHEMGLDPYGIDLSEEAVQFARNWADHRGITDVQDRVVQGSASDLQWGNEFFDVIVSHAVLDSMPFETACTVVEEVHRVLQVDGFFYCDLISGDDSEHAREYSGEEVISSEFEKGTIQSYFNYCKIKDIMDVYFEIEECKLVKREDVKGGKCNSRYHLTAKKNVI